MKRKLSILAVLLTLLVSACVKNEEHNAEDVISVSVPESTKVHIEGLKTCWDKGDAVTVFYRTDIAERWTYTGDTGEVSGQVRCDAVSRENTRNDIFVLYPYDENAALDGNVIHTGIPAVQQYRKDSYGTALLVSRSLFNAVTLKYCTGIVELKYRGPAEISHIVLSSRNGEKLSGKSTISFNGSEPVLSCDGEESVTLECNVDVLENEEMSFYFSIAPGTFTEGLSFTVHYKDGTTQKILSSESVSVEAGHVYTVKAGSSELPYTHKVIHLQFTDGEFKVNPFTEELSFKFDTELGPYYYELNDEKYPFYLYCKEKQDTDGDKIIDGKNFRQTNGGGLYIGGTPGDYIKLPAVEGYRLQTVAVSVHKVSDFYIVPSDAFDQIVPGGVCSIIEQGEFRLMSLSETEVGKSYTILLENQTCFRSITLYYLK